MAFITLQRASDDPTQALLVNAAQIIGVRLGPYDGAGDFAATVEILLVGQPALLTNFDTLQGARTAYNSLSSNLNPEATTISLY